MDPQAVFCPNLACPARGHVGRGNIGIHYAKERRYICHVCLKTFAESKGTVFYRVRTAPEQVTLVLTLMAHGCPLQAVVAAFQVDERTVQDWLTRAGQHCEQMQAHWVEQPRDLGHVQADEIRVQLQGAVVWLAMAVQVSTRLWLGAALGPQRDEALLARLMRRVRACALCRPLLFGLDGFRAYVPAIATVFREPIPTGRRGNEPERPWDGILIAQVVKQYSRGHVVGVLRRIVQGTEAQVHTALQTTQGGGVINTAYIERLNATFRARLASLVRRGRSLLREPEILHARVYLVGTIYNFCTDHESLRLLLYVGRSGRRHWVPRTPAMAAGITDHRWTVQELLAYHVPLERWTPPKRRGPVSKATKRLMERWCT